MLNICHFWLLNSFLNKHRLHVRLVLQWFCDCGHLVWNVSKLVIDMDVSHLWFYAMPDFLIHLPQIGNCITVVVCIHFNPVSLFNGLCCCFCVGFYLFVWYFIRSLSAIVEMKSSPTADHIFVPLQIQRIPLWSGPRANTIPLIPSFSVSQLLAAD